MRAALLLVVLVLAGCADTWRFYPPEPTKQVRVEVPIYRQHVLPNGLTFIHYETSKTPQVVIQLALRVGAAAVPERQAGLLWLWLSSLAEANRAEQQALDALGGTPSPWLDATAATISMTVAETDAAAALSSLARLVQTTKIEPSIFERFRNYQVALLRSQQIDPQWVSSRVLRKSLYGANHPLARPLDGTVNTVSELTPRDLEVFHQSYIGPSNLAVVVVGAIPNADALAATEKAFGEWQAPVQLPPPLPPAHPAARRTVWFAPMKGLGQSVLTIGGPGPAADQQYGVPFTIAAHLLASRINGRLRADDDVAYGAQLRISTRATSGHFAIAASAQVESTARAIEEMMGEAEEVAARGYSYSGRSMPYLRLASIWDLTATFNTLPGMADAGSEMYYQGRPLDYFRALLDALPNVTPEDVYQAGRIYLDPSRFQLVVVGEPGLAAKIAKLKLGPMEVEEPH